MVTENRPGNRALIGVVVSVVPLLYLSSLYSYLLFHTLIEIVSIAISCTIFILVWNARAFLANGYLRFLGIGYACISIIDLLHTLAYKGMDLFGGYGTDLPTQLWIAARYLQAVALVAAPLALTRRVDNRVIFGGFAAASAVVVALVYSRNFPVCYVEGQGLTPFKIVSEYVISALVLLALTLLYRKRSHFSKRIFILVASSLVCTIVSELCFTAYVSVYGFANLLGHFAKLAAFYLIYRSILVTGIQEPYELIFRELEKARAELEDQVARRTAELSAANERLRREGVEREKDGTALLHLNRELRAISECNQTLMRIEDEQSLLDEICRIVCEDGGYRMAWVGYAENDARKRVRPVAWGGAEDGYLAIADITWADEERGHGPTGTAVRTGVMSGIADFSVEAKAAPWREAALRRGYRSSLSLPLKDEGKRTFGALTIYSSEPGAFTTDEKRLLEELAGDLAFGLSVLRARRERLGAAEALRESEERYRLVFENSPVSIWEEDFSAVKVFFDGLRREGIEDIDAYLDQHPDAVRSCAGLAKIIDVNRAALALQGATAKEELLAGLASVFSEESLVIFKRELTCLWKGQGSLTGDTIVTTFAGEQRNATLYFSLCPGYEETLSKVIVSLIDVTELKRAERERQANLGFFENMDKINRALQGTNDLERMLGDVLDVVLSIFACDRAYLVYPCDPEAASYSVPMERTRAEYPGALEAGMEVPVDAETKRVFRTLLGSGSPVTFGPGSEATLPADLTASFGVQSQVALAIRPKVDRPYMFGLHQCSHPRRWTAEETRLLMEIGRRLEDGLTGLLAFRELRKLNEELEARVRIRTSELEAKNDELERFNRLFVDRELRMVELKERIKDLENRDGIGS
jgi:GAF domain-containing protein